MILGVNWMQSDNIIQRELYCRLNIDENVVSAAEFMPFIELLSLGNQLDKCLLETIDQKILWLSTNNLLQST